ncbi:nucleoside hydrolase [Imperialibacter roseus]|uniref:Nucleoside hydrolase n=1 Tax=Imperialibacter roseus TaxID=1324217 RepID=A0ABZ0ISM0_9BACT|nr:nucleoside hydrolase [Imperialibacter roseus]WOK07385.1 nucleoside hydrolase [Imperialibacter roseus]
MKNFSLLTAVVVLLGSAACDDKAKTQTESVQLIFDTDFGPDYDDVGAITLLHALADSGQVNILATVASCSHPNAAAAIDVFNTYFGRPGLPIGVPKGPSVADTDKQHWTDSVIANYPHRLQSNDEAPVAVEVYRKVLAAQPDGSVTVVTVGFFTNLANLLNSAPDQFSDLSGKQLVAKKVKQLVSMAGWFPTGAEYNVKRDPIASMQVMEEWPTPILLSGFHIGQKIKTGLPLINNAAIKNSPVKDVFRISIPLDPQDSAGRMSWDQTAVLVAVKGYDPYYSIQTGHMSVDSTGTNTWDTSGKDHARLVEKMEVRKVNTLIDDLMMYQPKK